MNHSPLLIREILEKYASNSISEPEVFSMFLDNMFRFDKEIKSFVTHVGVIPSQNRKTKRIPIAHKDIFSTKGIETTASSRILKGYIPPYDATVVSKLTDGGFATIGKLNCDAFAHGATGENSELMVTSNPYDISRVPGGSSSGSAAAVAAGFVPVATATDTGGSIRLPASYTNTVGIKPTYGRVSRYGVIAMTSSTDSIGHITKTVWDNAYVLGITAGYDPNDATTSRKVVPNYLELLREGVSGLTLGVPKEYLLHLDPKVEKVFDTVISTYAAQGAKIVEVSLPHTQYAIICYYIITLSEISSNLGRFDGIRFGLDRSQFGEEAKRRIMLGTYCLSAGYYDQYYRKAQKVRTLVRWDFDNALATVDALIAPVSPVLPPKIGAVMDDPMKNYMLDVLTVPVNLSGNPSLSVPAGFADKLPVGFQIIGKHFDEATLYRIGQTYENETEHYKTAPQFLTVPPFLPSHTDD